MATAAYCHLEKRGGKRRWEGTEGRGKSIAEEKRRDETPEEK